MISSLDRYKTFYPTVKNGRIICHNFLTRSEIDNYGFSVVLGLLYKFKEVPYSNTSWVHGWRYWTVSSPQELLGPLTRNIQLKRVVTFDAMHREYLLSKGFRRVYLARAPYTYGVELSNLLYPKVIRTSKVLFVLPKATEVKASGLICRYWSKIRDQLRYTNEIDVLVAGRDWHDVQYLEKLRESGLRNLIKGADINAPDALVQLHLIFSSYKCVISNHIGSWICYAAYSGAQVGIIPPYVSPVSDSVYPDNYQVRDYTFLNSQWPSLFVPHVDACCHQRDLATQALGGDRALTRDELLEILGWTVSERFLDLALAMRRRLL